MRSVFSLIFCNLLTEQPIILHVSPFDHLGPDRHLFSAKNRFLCPPPTAIMIGNSWWSDVVRRGEDPKLCPPRVVISISGEPAPQEGSIEWTGAAGKAFDVNDPPTGTTYIGRCVGKQLFISDVDEKKKKVEALVKIMAPASDDEPERVIGTFPSRPIKVISKPSKKRQSAKNLERTCKSLLPGSYR